MLEWMPTWLKFTISAFWDILDLTIGRIPIFGSFFDIAGGLLAIALWGVEGIIVFWEMLDVTDQLDSFIPTVTAIGVLSWYRNKGNDTEGAVRTIEAAKSFKGRRQ